MEKEGDETYFPDGASARCSVRELLGRVQGAKRTKDEIILLMKEIVDRLGDVEKARRVFMAEPNFYGLGVNLHELFNRIFGKND